MNITVEIKCPELAAAINNLAAAMGNRQLQAPTASDIAKFADENTVKNGKEDEAPKEKPARSAAKKQTTPPTSDPSEEAGSEAGAEEPQTEEKSEPAHADPEVAVIEYNDIKKAVMATSLAKGREAAVALLAEFGAKKGDEVPEERWAEFLARAAEVQA